MLWQFHWQYNDGRYDMRRQFDPKCEDFDFRELYEDVKERHPLPDGAQWFLCNEENEHFEWTVDSENYTKEVINN